MSGRAFKGGTVLRVRRRAAEPTPIRGLPGALPEGETLLWQGSPDWRTLRRRAFHVRGVAIYFGVILAWCLAAKLQAGTPAHEIAASMLRLLAVALVPVGLLALYAWGVARSTIYSITSQRVAISFGLVVPMTINLPYRRIEEAGLHTYPDGTGDIALRLLDTERLAYLLVWPHARPWRMARAEPMLRGIPGAAGVASLLTRALASHAALQQSLVQVNPVQHVQPEPGPRLAAQAA